MTSLKITGVCLLTLFILSQTVMSAGLAQRIEDAYKGIKDMKGDFVQKSFIKELGKEQTFRGGFLIKLPSRMRYTYKGENQDEIIINRDTVIIYQKKEKQAIRSPFNRNTYGSAPVSLLGGLGNLNEEFMIEEIGDNRLRLRPKKEMRGITSIEVEGAEGEFPIKSFKIFDKRSNTITIVLKNIKLNTGIKDSSFLFKTPPGVNIFDYEP